MARALLVASWATVVLPLVALRLGVGPGALEGQSTQRPEVTSLRFVGNESFSDNDLAASIVTRQTRCRSVVLRPFCWAGAGFAWDRHYLSERTLEDDYVRLYLFYRQHGYRSVQVDTVLTRRDDTVGIVFRIEEGEPHRITSFDVRGVQDVPSPPVTEGLPVREGDPLDLEELDTVRDSLTRRLQNRGYAHAEVLRNIFVPAGTRDAEVEFDVYTGPVARFGTIDVEGNEHVSDGVIRRMLSFGEGGVYRRELLFDAQRNLYGLEIFLNASITQDLDNEPDSIVPIRVQVNEGNTHRVRAGGGWNTEECFNLEATWANRNYFGGARRLQLRGRVSNLLATSLHQSVLCQDAGTGAYGKLDWVVSADFTQPFIFTPRNSLAASVYAERQSLQNVYVRKAVGLSVGLTRSVGRQTPLTLSYSPEIGRLDAAEVFFCTSLLVCDPDEIDLLQGSNVLAPVGLSIARDRSDSPISPTRGYRGLIDLESAGGWTGSDFEYERAVAEISAYHSVDDVVLAGRIRGGWLWARPFRGLSGSADNAGREIAHPEKRFYAGGANSVRGYAQNQLGPQVVSVEVSRLLLPVAGNENAACAPEEVVALTCDASSLETNQFSARPTGGTRLIEGNLEVRFPLWGPSVSGAAFVDFGRVWDGNARLSLDDLVFTPGLGFRYATPIGPIRFDVAYRGDPARQVPVVTSQIRPYDPMTDRPEDRIGDLDWVRRGDLALLGPDVTIGGANRFFQHLQLHISIGQAF